MDRLKTMAIFALLAALAGSIVLACASASPSEKIATVEDSIYNKQHECWNVTAPYETWNFIRLVSEREYSPDYENDDDVLARRDTINRCISLYTSHIETVLDERNRVALLASPKGGDLLDALRARISNGHDYKAAIDEYEEQGY